MSGPGSITPRRVAAPGQPAAMPDGGNALAGAASAIQDFAVAQAHARDQSDLVQARLGYSQKLDDLYLKYREDDDPATAAQRFAKEAQDLSAPFYDGLRSDQAKASFALDSGQQAESRRISMADLSLRRQSDIAVANLDALGDKAVRDAAYAGNPAARDAAIDSYAQSVWGVAESGMLTHQDAERRVGNFKTKLALYDGRRLIDGDPAAAARQLADPKFLPDLDPLSRVELQSQADGRLRALERERHAALAEARTNASLSLADLDASMASGLPVSRAIIDQAKADVGATGDPRLARHLENSLRAANFADSLRGATPREVEGALADVSASANRNGADPAMAAAFTGGRKFLDSMNTQLGQDPLAWAGQQGVIDLVPLQLNGQDSNQVWQQRIKGAETMAQHYGVAPRYLTGAEANQVRAQLAPGADATTKLLTLRMLTHGLGSRVVPELQRMGVSPALLTAGGLLTAGPSHERTAFDIVNGEAALTGAGKGGEGMGALRPTEAARALSVAGHGKLFGGVALPQGLPQVLEATALLPGEGARISAAADALYAARAPQRGLSGKDAATEGLELYQRALQEAAGARFDGDTQMGGLTQYRGRPVLAPATVAADGFEGAIQHLSNDDLARASRSGAAPVDPSGKPLADGFVRHAWLVTAGNGLYALSTTDPQQGALNLVHDAKGGIYRLDFPAALTLLQARAAKGAK